MHYFVISVHSVVLHCSMLSSLISCSCWSCHGEAGWMCSGTRWPLFYRWESLISNMDLIMHQSDELVCCSIYVRTSVCTWYIVQSNLFSKYLEGYTKSLLCVRDTKDWVCVLTSYILYIVTILSKLHCTYSIYVRMCQHVCSHVHCTDVYSCVCTYKGTVDAGCFINWWLFPYRWSLWSFLLYLLDSSTFNWSKLLQDWGTGLCVCVCVCVCACVRACVSVSVCVVYAYVCFYA